MPAPIVAGIIGLGRLAISAAPKAYRGIKAYRNARKLKKLQSQAARREAAQKSSRAARNADKSKFSKDKPKCTKNCKPKAGRESLNDAQLKNLKRYEKNCPKAQSLHKSPTRQTGARYSRPRCRGACPDQAQPTVKRWTHWAKQRIISRLP